MCSNYQFQNLSGIESVNRSGDFHVVVTGMHRDYDMRWMSTATDRRDFGSGVSGSHLASELRICLAELQLFAPYPSDSYQIILNGDLNLCSIQNIANPNFSGDYYDPNRSISCQIVDANRAYLRANKQFGLLRFSKPGLGDGRRDDVIAITEDAIGRLTVKQVIPLGNVTHDICIIHPDGAKVPISNYYSSK